MLSPRGVIKTLTSTNMFHHQTVTARKLKTIEENASQKHMTTSESRLWTGTVGEEGRASLELTRFCPEEEGEAPVVGHSPRRSGLSEELGTQEAAGAWFPSPR